MGVVTVVGFQCFMQSAGKNYYRQDLGILLASFKLRSVLLAHMTERCILINQLELIPFNLGGT